MVPFGSVALHILLAGVVGGEVRVRYLGKHPLLLLYYVVLLVDSLFEQFIFTF